jgi:hypothetical protein
LRGGRWRRGSAASTKAAADRAGQDFFDFDFDLRLGERFFVDLRLVDLRVEDLRLGDDLRDFFEDFFFGAFAPERRASESPIAIACLRLFTFFPERPLLSLPRFISCIAFFTFLRDFLPYLAAMESPPLSVNGDAVAGALGDDRILAALRVAHNLGARALG